ncbi:MAG: hypothetical protein NTX61_06480 [Bacteroidetes bacterium]|nr:hypothetical protein [Bacteroidota bacterium]
MLGFGIFVLPILLILAIEYPVFFFMLCLTIMTNIGGYFDAIFVFGRITLQDAAFILSFMILFSSKVHASRIFSDKGFRRLFYYLVGIALYSIIAALFVISGNELSFSFYALLNWRWEFFGFLSIIPGYLVAENPKLIVRSSIFVSLLILVLFFLTITTKLDLIPTEELSRDIQGVNVERITFAGHMSYLILIIWIGFFMLVMNIKMNNKLIILLIASFMLISQMLSLGRGINIFLIGSLFAALIYIRKYFHLQIYKLVRNMAVFFALTMVLLFFIFPDYLTGYYQTFFQSFLELIGIVPSGTTQSRSSYELVNQLPLIRENPLFGTGITPRWFENEEFSGNISDLPIVTILAMFGFIGTIIYFYSYYMIFKRMKQFYKQTGNYFRNFLMTNKYDVLLLLCLFVYFFSMVYFRLFNTGVEFIADYSKIEFYFFIGLMYGVMRKLEILSTKKIGPSLQEASLTNIESNN